LLVAAGKLARGLPRIFYQWADVIEYMLIVLECL
jgi:hypothetical protein